MAELRGPSSGLRTCVSTALESAITLHNTILGFKPDNTRARDLANALQELKAVLKSLSNAVNHANSIGLLLLDVPLLRCKKACDSFRQQTLDCCLRSGVDQKSFDQWRSLKYIDDGIGTFKQVLFMYKSTIEVALACSDLSSVTIENFDRYDDLAKTTINDIQEHLASIDEKLEAMPTQDETASNLNRTELETIEDEMNSMQRCVQICEQWSGMVELIRANLETTTISVEEPASPSPSQSKHGKENVSIFENIGTGDNLQFMVSANGQILHGKNEATGWVNRQYGGYINNDALVKLSRDMLELSRLHMGENGNALREESTSRHDKETDVRQASGLGKRWR